MNGNSADKEIVRVLVREFRLKGISNLQVAANSNGIFIIELNAKTLSG